VSMFGSSLTRDSLPRIPHSRLELVPHTSLKLCQLLHILHPLLRRLEARFLSIVRFPQELLGGDLKSSVRLSLLAGESEADIPAPPPERGS
jgi:hypothetical protein